MVIQGAPLIRHVVEALFATPGLSRVRIVVEPQTAAAIAAVLPGGPVAVDFVDGADNLADSVHAAGDPGRRGARHHVDNARSYACAEFLLAKRRQALAA